MNSINVSTLQKPLRSSYAQSPERAKVVDSAVTHSIDIGNPFRTEVTPMPEAGDRIPVGVHRNIGGSHEAATPGDMLCAALAACQDSTIRMIANILGVRLEFLEVEVRGDVDVRGTMMVDRQVPVGFQRITSEVSMRLDANTKPALVEKLKYLSNQCCVVQQTLKNPPPINCNFKVIQPEPVE